MAAWREHILRACASGWRRPVTASLAPRWATGSAAPAHAQKTTLGDDERATQRVQALRQAFQAEVTAVAPEQFVFVDESGVNWAMTRTHARSPYTIHIAGSFNCQYDWPRVIAVSGLNPYTLKDLP